MLPYFNPITKFFKALGSDGTPNQLAMGATLGMIIGLQPIGSGVFYLALYILLLFNVSFTMAGVAFCAFYGLAYLLGPYVSYPLGHFVVESLGSGGTGPIGSTIKTIGESGALNWTKAHYYLYAGATALGLLAAIPFYFLMRIVVHRARQAVQKLVGFDPMNKDSKAGLAALKTIDYARKSALIRWVLWIFAYDFYVMLRSTNRAHRKADRLERKLKKLKRKLEAAQKKKAAEAVIMALETKIGALEEQHEEALGEARDEIMGSLTDSMKEAALGNLSESAQEAIGSAEEGMEQEEEEASEEVDPEDKAEAEADKKAAREEAKEAAEERAKQLKPKPVFRRAILVLSLIVIGVPAALAATLFFGRNTIVKTLVEGQVSRQLGMPIKVGGVDIDFNAKTLILNDVQIGPTEKALKELQGDAGQSQGDVDPKAPVLVAKRIEGGVDVAELFKLRVHLTLKATEPVLTLVRLPSGAMNYQGEPSPAGTAAASEGDWEEVLDENGNPVYVEEWVTDPVTGERKLVKKKLWRNKKTGERAASEKKPDPKKVEGEKYDPKESNTWDTVKKFLEDMSKKAGDDPEKSAKRAKDIYELFRKKGTAAADNPVIEEMIENGASAEEIAAMLDKLLLGSASYVLDAPGKPAPNKPTFWVKGLTLSNVSVRYVDLRPNQVSVMKQDHYTVDVRNVATQQYFLNAPPVVLLARGVASDVTETLASAALKAPPLFGQSMQDFIAFEKASETDRATMIDPRSQVVTFLMRIEEGFDLQEIAGLFTKKGDTLPFKSGRISLYTAAPSYAERDWAKDRTLWWFDPTTGKPAASFKRLDDGSLGFSGGALKGVFVVQLENVVLNKGAFGMPDFLFEFLNQFMGDDLAKENNWRFVVLVQDKLGSPQVKLLNEPEVTAKLRQMAVKAVQKFAANALGEVLDKLLDREQFALKYGAKPEFYLCWESTAAGAEAAAAAWKAARGEDVPFVSVVTPLLFAGDKGVFLGNIGFNAVTICRVVVVDWLNSTAGKMIDDVLRTLNLPGYDEIKRQQLRTKLLRDVAETLVPKFTLAADGKPQFEAAGAFQQRMNAAMQVLSRNAGEVMQEVSTVALQGVIGEVVKLFKNSIGNWPPDYSEEQLKADLSQGVGEAMFPVATGPDGMPKFEVKADAGTNKLVENAGRVVPKLSSAVVDALVNPLAGDLTKSVGTLPRGWTPTRIVSEVKAGVAEAYFPPDTVRRGPDGKFDFKPNPQGGQAKAVENFKSVVTRIAADMVEAIITEGANTVTKLFPQLPPGYTKERVAAELRDGVGVATVQGAEPGNVKLNAEAGKAKLDSNAVKVLRGMAEASVKGMTDKVVGELVKAIKPLPGGQTPQTIAADLSQGVGAAMIEGNTLAAIAVNPAKAAGQLSKNAVVVARKLSGPLLQDLARGALKPVAEPLKALLGVDDKDIDQAAVTATTGADAALFPEGSVTVAEDGSTTIKPDNEAAAAKIRENAKPATAEIAQKGLTKRVATGLMMQYPEFSPEEKAQFTEAFFMQKAAFAVPAGTGQKFVDADEAGRKTITDGVMAAIQPNSVAAKAAAREILPFRCNLVLEKNKIVINPKINDNDTTVPDLENFAKAPSRVQTVKDVLKRTERVVDAVVDKLGLFKQPDLPPFLPKDQVNKLLAEAREKAKVEAKKAIDKW